MADVDEFDSVRNDPDPLRRGQRATELLTLYQQRSTELARLRKAAIEEAHRELGMSYSEIATAIGLTKGRVSQIRAAAPGPERAFFGIGPVSIGIPLRYGTADRERPLIAAEDDQTGDQFAQFLGSLAFTTTRYQIEPTLEQPPAGDGVVVCGPKSAPMAADLMSRDPALRIVEDAGRWWIDDLRAGDRYGSPTDDEPAQAADIAYVARHRDPDRVLVHVAGVHGIGSLGAAHYLVGNLAELFAELGDVSCSLAVRCEYDGLTVQSAGLLAGPYVW